MIKLFFPVILMVFFSCTQEEFRTFSTSFESISDFDGFSIVPQNYMGTSSHELSKDQVYSGTYAHKGWIYGTNPESAPGVNNNHRAYPTIQLHKTPGRSFRTPCYITLKVWLDMKLQAHSPENQWFSFATLTSDETDQWNRVVTINLSYQGIVQLVHVPYQGSKEHIFQTDHIYFPQRQWVEIKIYADFRVYGGYLKVWQDGKLVSHALYNGGNGYLAQAHFGLYAAPSIASGVIYNDDLEIREVAGE